MKIDRELYERVKKITCTDYEADYPKEPDDKYGESWVIMYDQYAVDNMLEDLLLEMDRLEERIEDIIEDRDTNYKRIDVASQARE